MSNHTSYPEAISPDHTFLCQIVDKIDAPGSFMSQNLLHFSTPLILVQFSAVTIVAILIDVCIKPLGVSLMISRIIGGIIFGPSVLGHEAVIGETLFPPRGRYTFETFATFGLMFFVFAVAVQMDSKMVIRPGGKAILLGVCSMFIPLIFAVPLSMVLKPYVSASASVSKSLPIIAASQSITSFANVSCLLNEMKMLQTDIGRVAIPPALICDVIGFCLMSIAVAVAQTSTAHSLLMPVLSVFITLFSIVGIVFFIGPMIERLLTRIPEGKSLKELHILSFFLAVPLFGFLGELIGQHFPFGPTLLGFAVPEGPPLGAALVDKLDLPIAKFLFPAFLATSGLKTDIFLIKLESLWVVAVIVVLCSLVKIGVVMFTACCMDISAKESFVLGLIYNSKGVFELILYNILMDAQVLKGEAFSLCILSVILVTTIITPLIKFLHKSKLDVPIRRRTIQHTKRDSELRIMVCIHNQEEVTSMVNLLESSNATEDSPVAVIAVLLVELVGRAAPMLIAHQSHRIMQPSLSRSGRIINALRQYELHNETCVTIRSFSSISQYETMYEDICRVALDQNVTIIVLPFHKRWEIDGSIGSTNRAIQQLNSAVADKSPCSIGILVDRRILGSTLSILNSQSIFRVAVIFIGGPDDAEALAYGARMAGHPNSTVTVIRFLMFGYDNARDRKFDNHLIDEVRRANMGNERFIYQEEIMRDGVGLAAAIRGLDNSYDLIVVGMHHHDSPLLEGLGAWIDCPELGIIGDMLAAPELKQIASILVVQQQRVKAKLINRAMKPVVADQDPFLPS